MNTGIFYGSNMGTTENVANRIALKMGVGSDNIINVAKASADAVLKYDNLLLGSSTWGLGELQDDWDLFINKLKAQNLAGKKVAIFGCGDNNGYEDTFCDAIGIIHEALQSSGCTFIGAIQPSDIDYTLCNSKVCKDGKYLGLAIDEENESNKTDKRIATWVELIKRSI